MRCKCFVIDVHTHRQRKCLKKTCYTACYVHARKFASKIQRAYRGYRTRRKLNVFQKLPSELWDRVLYYTRYQHNVQTKFRRSVLKVFDQRINYSPTGLIVRNGWPDRHHLDIILNYRIERNQLVKFFNENDLIIT